MAPTAQPELTQALAVLGKPYTLTRSQIGAVTKVYEDRYICDPAALKQLCERMEEKLAGLEPTSRAFSFLISYSDRTHHDGMIQQLANLKTIETGKTSERVVLKWGAKHKLGEEENELSITVRISNPINPLLFFQAALSKAPSDLDNLEFELGSTCVTVNGAGQFYAEEVFLAVQNWINARNKPHSYMDVRKYYNKFEWLIDQTIEFLFPFLALTAGVTYAYQNYELKGFVAFGFVSAFCIFAIRDWGRRLNNKMAHWANRSRHFSVFQLTNGDIDALAKIAALSKNSAIKLIVSSVLALALNVIAGIFVASLFP